MLYPKEHQPCLELQQELTDITRKYNAAKEKVAKYKAALQEKNSELEVIKLNEQLQKKVIDKFKKCQISHSLERNRRLHMMKFHMCTYSPRTTATQNASFRKKCVFLKIHITPPPLMLSRHRCS